MNTKSKLKEFLNKHNQTDDGMKAIWEELAKISEVANCIYKSVEQNWQKIPLHLLEESLTCKRKNISKERGRRAQEDRATDKPTDKRTKHKIL